ncbi:MAG: hypothetical protein ACREA9_16645, partial [Pyrinomonadaceae bacterium]
MPGNIFGLQHYWIKTDKMEAGMGAEGAGVPGQGAKDCPFVRTSVNDHTGECNNPEAICEEITGANQETVNRQLQLGSYQGRWLPPFNDCRTFACGIAYPSPPSPQHRYESMVEFYFFLIVGLLFAGYFTVRFIMSLGDKRRTFPSKLWEWIR